MTQEKTIFKLGETFCLSETSSLKLDLLILRLDVAMPKLTMPQCFVMTSGLLTWTYNLVTPNF